MNARVHFSKSWKFNSNQKFKKSLLKTTTMSIKKILSNKISHKYNFHEEIHLLFKIKYLLLQFIYNISTSKCFHVLRSIGNPALQRVQFDQNLSPIRTQRSARVPCKSGVKRKATRRRYRLPLSWDIIGHGRAIRMPDWPHTTYISRGKLTRSWLNGKRYHTPPFRNWLVLEFQGINWQTPVPRLSVHIASLLNTSSAAHYAVLLWLNRVGNPLESTVLSNVHVYCHFKYRVPYNVQTWTRFGTGTD